MFNFPAFPESVAKELHKEQSEAFSKDYYYLLEKSQKLEFLINHYDAQKVSKCPKKTLEQLLYVQKTHLFLLEQVALCEGFELKNEN